MDELHEELMHRIVQLASGVEQTKMNAMASGKYPF